MYHNPDIQYVTIFTLLVISCLQHSSAENRNLRNLPCPSACSCFTNHDDDVVVNCTTERFPSSLPLDTAILSMTMMEIPMHNPQKVQIPGYSFQNYFKLRYLVLSSGSADIVIRNDSLLGLEKLEKLVLKDVLIDCDRPFRDLRQLKVFDVKGDHLFHWCRHCLNCFDLAIRDLKQLEHLIISDWEHGNLTHGFSFLTKLKILELTGSFFCTHMSVTRSSFAALKNLHIERLSLRSISHTGPYIEQDERQFEPLALSELKYLKTVDLSDNNDYNVFNTSFKWTDILQSFQNTSTLHTLIMDKLDAHDYTSKPPIISSDAFAPLKNIKLKRLSLQWNRISVFEQKILKYLPYLEYLNLDNNVISIKNFYFLPEALHETFVSIVVEGRIKELHISNQYRDTYNLNRNILSSVNPLFLADDNSDENISVTASSESDKYEVPELYPEYYFPCKNTTPINIVLERLFLSNYPSIGYQRDHFRKAVYLSIDFLSDTGGFCDAVTNHLRYLDLSSSSIREIVRPIYLEHLEELNLEDNSMENVPPLIFKALPRLQKLWLSKNRFGLFKNRANLTHLFSDLASLELLDLSDNMLDVLEERMFENCEKLETLKLAENMITSVEFKFSKLPNLKELDLSRNHLTGLNETQIAELEKIALDHNLTVKLDRNQNFQCTCGYIPFIKWVRRDSERKTEIPSFLNLTCKTVEGDTVILSNVDVKSLYLECIKNDLVIGCITIFMCVLLMVIILWYQRWTLKYWYYKYKLARKVRNDNNIEQPFIDYDAYICYPEVDLQWANNIRQQLEGEMNVQVFFPARDVIPGGDICEETVRGIDASKKIVICINENFEDNGYQNFAVRMSCVRGKGFIIPIIKGDIPVNRLPRVLRHLLRDDVYLDWPITQADENKFWKNLKRAIKTRKGVYIEKGCTGVYYAK